MPVTAIYTFVSNNRLTRLEDHGFMSMKGFPDALGNREMKPLIQKTSQNKVLTTDPAIGVVEHPNGKTYHIKYVDDNAPNAKFVITDAASGKRLGGFETYAKAIKAAQNRDKEITEPIYQEDHPLKIAAASKEEIEAAMQKVFPRSELTKQLNTLQIMEGLKVEGELKKVRQAVYSFAQLSKRKFTVRPAGDNGWLLVIRLS